MRVYLALSIVLLSGSPLACLDDPVPYIPIVFESGQYISKPELLTKQHIQRAKLLLNRCLSENGSVTVYDGILYIGRSMLDNKPCIASVTEEIENELLEFKAQFKFNP